MVLLHVNNLTWRTAPTAITVENQDDQQRTMVLVMYVKPMQCVPSKVSPSISGIQSYAHREDIGRKWNWPLVRYTVQSR